MTEIKEYKAYFLAEGETIIAGPFPTVDAAIDGKKKFTAPYQASLDVIRGSVVGYTL